MRPNGIPLLVLMVVLTYPALARAGDGSGPDTATKTATLKVFGFMKSKSGAT